MTAMTKSRQIWPRHWSQSTRPRQLTLNQVGESYFEHSNFAGRFAVKLLAAGLAALVHAILPFAFEKTASNRIREIYAMIDGRGQPASNRSQVPGE